MAKCSSGQSGSYQSETSLPDGYCIWQWDGAVWILQDCHCKQGTECEDPNQPTPIGGKYYLELRKFPCS